MFTNSDLRITEEHRHNNYHWLAKPNNKGSFG